MRHPRQSLGEFFRLIDNYLAVIQHIRNNNEKLRKKDFPIGILILKSDLLIKHNITEHEVLKRIQRLIGFLKIKFSNVNYFFISSFGVDFEQRASPKLNPFGLVDPIVWSLKFLRM